MFLFCFIVSGVQKDYCIIYSDPLCKKTMCTVVYTLYKLLHKFISPFYINEEAFLADCSHSQIFVVIFYYTICIVKIVSR